MWQSYRTRHHDDKWLFAEQEFFDALWTELEPFRDAYPHKDQLGPDHNRLWKFVEQYGDVNRMTWLRIVPGMPGNPTTNIKQSSNVSGEISLDVDETRQLIGWPPPP
jgi:hypothetical protein